jgi:hypothetical protein
MSKATKFILRETLAHNVSFLCSLEVDCFSRPVIAPLYKKRVTKSRQWRSLESSVEVLRLRKCDEMRHVLSHFRPKICTRC